MFGWKMARGRRLALIGGMVCAGSLALAAVATAQAPDWHRFRHRDGMMGDHGEMGSPAMRSLRLAQRLAGLEIYLAITPEQQPQWRAFTAALLGMMPDRPPPASDAFAAIDQITARVQAMSQPAQHLHDATDALKAVLTPDQIGKANAIWASMRPHGHGGPGMPGGGAPPPGAPPHL